MSQWSRCLFRDVLKQDRSRVKRVSAFQSETTYEGGHLFWVAEEVEWRFLYRRRSSFGVASHAHSLPFLQENRTPWKKTPKEIAQVADEALRFFALHNDVKRQSKFMFSFYVLKIETAFVLSLLFRGNTALQQLPAQLRRSRVWRAQIRNAVNFRSTQNIKVKDGAIVQCHAPRGRTVTPERLICTVAHTNSLTQSS